MSKNTVLIVGSIALDTVETPFDKKHNIIGGSTTFSLIAAERYSNVAVVGIVGDDFPKEGHLLYDSYAKDVKDLKIIEGKTFRWGGKYHANWNDRDTLFTDLGVFADFEPVLSDSNQNRSHILLANIHPDLQFSIISQNKNPNSLIVVDTMNLWIETTPTQLKKVLSASNILLINEGESIMLTGEKSINAAASSLLKLGPEIVVIKKGSNGAELFSNKEHLKIGAFPVKQVIDPTGAGDVFAGAFTACLSAGKTSQSALLNASAMASICIESFGTERVQSASNDEIRERVDFLSKTVKS